MNLYQINIFKLLLRLSNIIGSYSEWFWLFQWILPLVWVQLYIP